MENSKANVYTCFPITFGFSISKVLTHCNICWMQTNNFFQFRLYVNWILFSFIFFDHLVQVCPVIITKKVGAMAAYLCCLVPCRLWRFKFAIPQTIATASDLTQIIQIWFVGRNEGLVVRCVRVLQLVWYSFSTNFIYSVWQNRNLIFVRHMLEANGFPAIRSILSVSMRELGMNHQNCNFCGNKLGPDSSINFFFEKTRLTSHQTGMLTEQTCNVRCGDGTCGDNLDFQLFDCV